MDFETLWKRAEVIHLDRTNVRVASIPDLIEMKRKVGRPQDLTDIEALEAILAKRREWALTANKRMRPRKSIGRQIRRAIGDGN
jgi:hypothetical protein